MSQRTICIQNPARLSVRYRSLKIEGEKGVASIPLEDIWVIILESHVVQITVSALSAIVDSGIGVMVCDDQHMPSGLLLPLGAHSRHAAIVEDQLAISKPLAKRIWQAIVKRKIENQARVLDLLGYDSSSVRRYIPLVTSGDKDNREASAAAAYFKQLIENGTRRNSIYTAALDYGYAVIRAGIAREAVSGGWLVSRGIHHDSSLNAFNLVDDLIEPFRPVVDYTVCSKSLFGELNAAKRAALAALFDEHVLVGDKLYSVQTAIRAELEGLKRAVTQNDASFMLLPTIVVDRG